MSKFFLSILLYTQTVLNYACQIVDTLLIGVQRTQKKCFKKICFQIIEILSKIAKIV